MHPDSSIYLQLLAAFLTLNNEYVPSPLQVARVISSRTRNTSEHSHRLRALCNVASRPRTTVREIDFKLIIILIFVKDLANVKAKKTLVLKEENTIQAPTAASEDLKEKEEVEQEFEEMETEDKEEEIVPVVVEKKIEEVPEASSRKKKNSESSTTATSTVAKKKKKSVVNDVKTNLLEGEASVDDILNLFDMS